MKDHAELVARLRTAALATHAFPTARGRSVREAHKEAMSKNTAYEYQRDTEQIRRLRSPRVVENTNALEPRWLR